MIYITIVRPGKQPVTQSAERGATLESILVAAGIAASDYRSWTFTDEDGEPLTLTSTFDNSLAVIAGQRVQGA